ncbi:MAG: DUF4381 domain-containing protein [Propionivibrio sp.]|uniref:DUF4381 domain-containing protein n=1 Tax=Propionivibrio sp. TaxID=2212460 RepID=UPI0025D06618|nr:DUF4381 domain-containing protein [Propionivibrio sp.]MBK8399801.1 DUF4381 domain-containing protein [Propionivibrio sp.]MBK8894675.1 DUF4381 domain-containing protein [Propionivibrio sp.]MBL0207157.1 DUF4381 domain-containing protein [Propionivibrio sp.]
MNPDWLAQLAPPHAPPPAGWWPLAPGWWGLATLIAIVIAGTAYWNTRPGVRLRRIALRKLERLEALTSDDKGLANQLEHLLRRYAVARYGHDAVARLNGDQWIDFVVAHGGSDWAGAAGRNLLHAAYGGQATIDRSLWFRGARAFIKGRK